MEDFSLDGTKVIIGFPNITEIRIGSALRIAMTYYQKINEEYDGMIAVEKLCFVLSDLKNVYKFKTVENFINFVLSVYFEEKFEVKGMETEEISVFNEINKKLGYDTIPIKMKKYLDDFILPKLIAIAIQNMLEMNEENELGIYGITVKKQEYIDIYQSFFKDNDIKEYIHQFSKDLFSWLEYNQILRIENVYVLENGDIQIPIKFRFLEKIGGI